MNITEIKKRDGSTKEFSLDKVTEAVLKAMQSVEHGVKKDAEKISGDVLVLLEDKKSKDAEYIPTVEEVQDMVEEALMKSDFNDVAKAYIIYRDKRTRERSPDIFKKRANLKPYEYPQLLEYVDSIRHSYWLHTEFNYTSDIQDFKNNISDTEREILKKTMLAIAQIEVSVKTFWGDIYKHLPKPEVGAVGMTFAESEVRHADAYAHLLEITGLNDDFKSLTEKGVIKERMDYLNAIIEMSKSEDRSQYSRSVLLFSLFVEHVSLFSQFLIIMSFNKYKNLFKGISNAVEATSKEEQIHGLFGIELINIIKEEHPEWFDKKFEQGIVELSEKAMASEESIIDWIYEDGELDFLPKNLVIEFIKNRFNNSLESIGMKKIFAVDEKMVEETEWFDEEVISTKQVDFFNKRSINYNKRKQSVTTDDLF